MLRLLLLIPTTTYRTEDFVAAASKLDVELMVASERPNVLEAALPDNLLTLDFDDPQKAARTVAEFSRRHRVDAVVPVDDAATARTLKLERLIGQLGEAPRSVITLFYYEGRSVEQVASILGMPTGTVKTHLSRARAALRAGWGES